MKYAGSYYEVPTSKQIRFYSDYSVNPSTGKITLSGYSSVYSGNTNFDYETYKYGYYDNDSSHNTRVLKSGSVMSSSNIRCYYYSADKTTQKSWVLKETLQSYNPEAYVVGESADGTYKIETIE